MPLNEIAYCVLDDWRAQQEAAVDRVFKNQDGSPLKSVKKAWAGLLAHASIKSFRWHDMRHHFASKLVMNGVDLNTVRELMGHTDITMTLRYAHLAPEHKAQAVSKLVAKNK
jgi:site-specific recombinase XerD